MGWAAIACFVVAVALSLIGQATEAEPLYLLSGLLLLTSFGLAIALLPVWHNLGLRLPAMPGLFPRVGPGQEWDPATGTPVQRTAAGAAKRLGKVKKTGPRKSAPRDSAPGSDLPPQQAAPAPRTSAKGVKPRQKP